MNYTTHLVILIGIGLLILSWIGLKLYSLLRRFQSKVSFRFFRKELQKRYRSYRAVEHGIMGESLGIPFALNLGQMTWNKEQYIKLVYYISTGSDLRFIINERYENWDVPRIMSWWSFNIGDPAFDQRYSMNEYNQGNLQEFFSNPSTRSTIEELKRLGFHAFVHINGGIFATQKFKHLQELPSSDELTNIISILGKLPHQNPRAMLAPSDMPLIFGKAA